MALLKSISTRFGIECPGAYHRIVRVVAERMNFAGPPDAEGNPTTITAPGAVITTGVWATAAAAAASVQPVEQITVTVQLTAEAAGPLIAQAYELVKLTPEYAGALDA